MFTTTSVARGPRNKSVAIVSVARVYEAVGIMHSDASSGCGKLDAYFDGELAPSEQATFNAHLAACAACREAIEQQRWVDELLRSDDAAQQLSLIHI